MFIVNRDLQEVGGNPSQPGTENDINNDPKGATNTLNVTLKVNLLQWPGGLREAL